MRDIEVTIKLKPGEAVELSGILAMIATINSLPNATNLCQRLLDEVHKAMEKASDVPSSTSDHGPT